MALEPRPIKPTVPPAPQRGEERETFVAKANPFVSFLSTLATYVEDSLTWMQSAFNATETLKNEAEASAGNSAAAAGNSAASAVESSSFSTASAASAAVSTDYAIGTGAGNGSSKQWATSETEVADGNKGAKGYALDAANSAGSAAADFTATSSSSHTIGYGSKVFAIELGKAFIVGQSVQIYDAGNIANKLTGRLTSASDGSITVDVTNFTGSGSSSDWAISLFQAEQENPTTAFLLSRGAI